MHLATVRIHDTEVLSLACPRIDARSGVALLALVSEAAKRGARKVVLDLGPSTVIDFAGARALETASAQLGGGLVLAGLGGRARTLLRSVRVAEQLQMVEWWADAA